MKKKVLIFFLAGFILYLIDIGLNSNDENEIYISEQEINGLINAWTSRVKRAPNDDEIIRILNDYINEEILYREALKLGLDKDDRIIKRRLGQKISFLKQETQFKNPTTEDLINFYEKNKDLYYVSATYSFTHYYFSNEQNGKERSILASKKINDPYFSIDSDPFFLGKNFVEKTESSIDRDFGKYFSKNFDNVELNTWIGPLESAYGYHIVKIKNIKDGYYPPIETIYTRLEANYATRQKEMLLNEYIEFLKTQYTVITPITSYNQ